jgi:hypothetical protein
MKKVRKEVVEEIIVWSRNHHTGDIDELFEVNLGDLLRFLSQEETNKQEVKVKLFNKKTHEHEYCWGTDKCFCGKVYKGKG